MRSPNGNKCITEIWRCQEFLCYSIATMKSVLFLSLLAISLCTSQAEFARPKDGKADEAAKSASQEGKELNEPAMSAIQNPFNAKPPAQTSENQTANTSGDSPEWVNFLNAISTAIIALFTICLFIGLVVQIQTSRNTERAWMMVDVTWNPTSPLKLVELTKGSGEENTGAFFRVTYRNQGRSPAWIIEKRIALKIVDSVPSKPDFGSTAVIQKIPEPLAVNGPTSMDVQCDCGGRSGFPKLTIVYGAFKYRDIFRRIRETRFGYAIGQNNSMERLEEPEYNEHT